MHPYVLCRWIEKANRIKGKQWDDTMFQMEIDANDEDLEVIKNPMATSKDIQEHMAFMISQKRKNVEVSLRNCNAEERIQFEEANDKETYRWVSNSVFKIVRRAGVPIKRIMAMRWILTWKEAPDGTKAKARLVAIFGKKTHDLY